VALGGKETMEQPESTDAAERASGSLERVVRRFDVVIPNKRGDGIAYTIPIAVPVRIEGGIEILTPEAIQMIEATQLYHVCWLRDLRGCDEGTENSEKEHL
jgi:hypothetical protein